jgi:hypothetical protein
MSDWTGGGVTITESSTRYATVAEFKTWIGIADTVDDALIGPVLDDASRDVDDHCRRFFYQTAAATARYYTALRSDRIQIEDCVSLSAVATDTGCDRTYATVWTATDYDLLPDNAATDGQPYTGIEVAPTGSYSFPTGLRKGVKLTGVWGWPAVPVKVARATLLRAAWLFKRKDSPLGLAGNNDLGLVRVGRWDPDFEKLLEPYRLIVVT